MTGGQAKGWRGAKRGGAEAWTETRRAGEQGGSNEKRKEDGPFFFF